MRKLIILAGILIVLLLIFSYVGDRLNIPQTKNLVSEDTEKVKVMTEESVVIDSVKKVGPSVVTIVEDLPLQTQESLDLGPFSIFGFDEPSATDPEPRNIGTGFIVSSDGLIVTNKHVVSDPEADYQILTSDDKRYNVLQIYRDPLNDIAILKVNANGLKPADLGDSSNLQVGQFVIAIGTALGDFRNTVTTGVISGLGRGVTAGSPFEGFAERLDNVIQTDAAINPGNSGGPLLNSSSQVIGVNTAVASSAQNIGFALPINVIKESLQNFNQGGQFNRAFLGVSYRMIDSETAIINDVVAGAFIDSISANSPASQAELERGDIITHLNNKRLEKDKFELSTAVSQNKIGDRITLKVWREGQTRDVVVTLAASPNQ